MPALKPRLEHFSFLVGVGGIDIRETAPYEDRLFAAGCNDATILVIDGELRLDFDRAAETYELAVASAASDIERAGGTIIYVEPASGIPDLSM